MNADRRKSGSLEVDDRFSEMHVYPDAERLADEAAAWLCRQASASSGRIAICLSGGSTPQRLYQKLARSPIRERFPWDRVHWFWGDERFVSPDHPDSNSRMAREAMLNHAPVAGTHIHPVPTTGLTPAEAAVAYARALQDFYGAAVLDAARPLFEVTLLGLGDDGHTASLFPGNPTLDERSAWAASVVGARPEPRITLTYPVLEASRHVAFLVAGASKRETLAAIHRGEPFPAAALRPRGRLHWFVDHAAASGLPR